MLPKKLECQVVSAGMSRRFIYISNNKQSLKLIRKQRSRIVNISVHSI